MNKLRLKTGALKSSLIIIISFSLYVGLAFYIFANPTFFNQVKSTESLTKVTEGVIVPNTTINIPEIFNVDPLQSSTTTDSVLEIRKNISALVFSSLFKRSPTGGIETDLVESYEFTEAKDLKIKLKPEVYWHDGQKLTTKDVVYTLNQIKSVSKNTLFYGATNGGDIKYDEVLNDQEMIIRLYTNPNAPKSNIAYLYELVFPILPSHLLSDYTPAQILLFSETNFAKKPIGTGKFKFQENLGTKLILARNENYYGKKVQFDEFELKLYQDYTALKKDFTLRNVDFLTRKELTADDTLTEQFIEAGGKAFNTTVKERNTLLYFNLAYKEESLISRSIGLRKSLESLIDRTTLINALGGNAQEIYGPIATDSWAYLPEVTEANLYNQEKFRTQVEALGYKKTNEYYEKDGKILGFTLTYLIGDSRAAVAKTIQETFKTNGVKVTLKQIGGAAEQINDNQVGFVNNSQLDEYSKLVTNRDFEVLLTTTSQYLDPDRFNEWHSLRIDPPGINLSGYNSLKADAYLVEGRLEPDIAKRKESYAKFQRSFLQDVPAIYLLNPKIVTIYSPRLENLEQGVINDIDYKYSNISDWVVKN